MVPATDPASSSSSAPLTVEDGYLAMYYLVRDYWERGGKREASVTLLLNAIGPFKDPTTSPQLLTTDPALWDDWLAAIEHARREGLPREL
jgi:hypothetical protein